MTDFDIVGLGGRILSALLVIPYFAWGIYTLRVRYRYHEDLAPLAEAITLVAVVIFYAVETVLLRVYTGHTGAYFIFAMLGLAVSGAALYGPMAVSLASQLLVDVIAPAERSKTREPRYEPAEALEREADYEGALREYMVMARIFPQEPTAHLRIADLYMSLSQPEQAAPWFERALQRLNASEKSLQITNRLCEIYLRQLNRPEEAIRLLEGYLAKYPDGEYAPSVEERLRRVRASCELRIAEGTSD